jgi:hypothetical protein
MTDINILQEPMLVTIGKSLHDPDVQKANAKFQARRRRINKQLKLARLTLQAISISNVTFEMLDAADDDDDSEEIFSSTT